MHVKVQTIAAVPLAAKSHDTPWQRTKPTSCMEPYSWLALMLLQASRSGNCSTLGSRHEQHQRLQRHLHVPGLAFWWRQAERLWALCGRGGSAGALRAKGKTSKLCAVLFVVAVVAVVAAPYMCQGLPFGSVRAVLPFLPLQQAVAENAWPFMKTSISPLWRHSVESTAPSLNLTADTSTAVLPTVHSTGCCRGCLAILEDQHPTAVAAPGGLSSSALLL
jgi:hypothetical protein